MWKSFKYISTGISCLLRPARAGLLPIHAQIEPTNICNMKCSFCIRDTMFDNYRHMSLAEYKNIIDSIHPVNITLSGLGEPMLNPDLFEMCTYAHPAAITVTTNGTLLEKYHQKIPGSGITVLNISLDAATEQTFNRSRNSDKFRDILHGIETLVSCMHQYSNVNPLLRTSFVLTKYNVHEIPEFIKLNSNLGIRTILFQPLDFFNDGDERKDLAIADGRVTELLHNGIEAANLAQISTNLTELVSDWHSINNRYQEGITRGCLFPWFSAYIDVHGDVRVCCRLAYSKQAVMGNIFMEKFKTLWNNEAYQDFRTEMRKNRKILYECTICKPPSLMDLVTDSLSKK